MKRLAFALALLVAPPALAAEPSEMLKDPVLEKQAEELGRELRCLVCQNESIEDSNADLARDLRVIVRERIAKGETPDQVKQYVVDRYGDYVLLNPPFKASTLVLWLGPFALLVIGALAALAVFRRRAGTAPAQPVPLTAEEKRRLDALLKDGGQ